MRRLSIVLSIVVVLTAAVALAPQLATSAPAKKSDKPDATAATPVVKPVKPSVAEPAKAVATVEIPAPPKKSAPPALTTAPAKKPEPVVTSQPVKKPEPVVRTDATPKTVTLPKTEPVPTPKADEKAVRIEPKAAKPSQDFAYPGVSPGEVQVSPDVWAYQRYMRQDMESTLAARRAAEYRAEQRMHRVESRRWFGLSNQRPVASPDPFNGDYAPIWVSNYPFNPSRWVGMGY